jgi:hypothetical protein
MPLRSRMMSKLFAVWLVTLSVSPFTLPFSITDLIDILSHNDPIGEHVGCDALVKGKTATAPTLADHADASVLPAFITLAGTQPVAYPGRAEYRGVGHRILRL